MSWAKCSICFFNYSAITWPNKIERRKQPRLFLDLSLRLLFSLSFHTLFSFSLLISFVLDLALFFNLYAFLELFTSLFLFTHSSFPFLLAVQFTAFRRLVFPPSYLFLHIVSLLIVFPTVFIQSNKLNLFTAYMHYYLHPHTNHAYQTKTPTVKAPTEFH